jgi:rhodanese-related sulfurtransferase
MGLFCAGGWRSALAALTMQQMGVENVVHLDGGVGDCKQAGEPVAQRPAGRPAG